MQGRPLPVATASTIEATAATATGALIAFVASVVHRQVWWRRARRPLELDEVPALFEGMRGAGGGDDVEKRVAWLESEIEWR